MNEQRVNSLVPRRCCRISKSSLGTHCEISLKCMPQNLTDEKSTLVQVMAWCRQATSYYLSQCWPSSMSPNGVTRLQSVNTSTEFCRHSRALHSPKLPFLAPAGTPYVLLFWHVQLTCLLCRTAGLVRILAARWRHCQHPPGRDTGKLVWLIVTWQWMLIILLTLVQVMAWYQQATSHYLSQCWHRFMSL